MPQSSFAGNRNVETLIELLPKDQEDHSHHVGAYVKLLSKIMSGIKQYQFIEDNNLFDDWEMVAFYHDIGKIFVPIDILSKSGKLTDDEYAIVKKHTLFAEDIFNMIYCEVLTGMPQHILPLAYDAAVYHHEWFNGNGYPYGMSGKKIPLIARATAICDSYDAMTNWRTYRTAHSHDFACNELRKNSAIQFDPELVDIFLSHELMFFELSKDIPHSKK